jgi:hypothetical protein
MIVAATQRHQDHGAGAIGGWRDKSQNADAAGQGRPLVIEWTSFCDTWMASQLSGSDIANAVAIHATQCAHCNVPPGTM